MSQRDAELIAECLRRYRSHLKALEKDGTGEPLRVSLASEVDWDPPSEKIIDALLRDPIRSALRGRVREIGMKLMRQGGMDLMSEVSDKVESLCPDYPTFAGSTLDKWWDRITDGEQIWMS